MITPLYLLCLKAGRQEGCPAIPPSGAGRVGCFRTCHGEPRLNASRRGASASLGSRPITPPGG
eukprot:2393932-Alexandrium_andersonii.AAC.1